MPEHNLSGFILAYSSKQIYRALVEFVFHADFKIVAWLKLIRTFDQPRLQCEYMRVLHGQLANQNRSQNKQQMVEWAMLAYAEVFINWDGLTQNLRPPNLDGDYL